MPYQYVKRTVPKKRWSYASRVSESRARRKASGKRRTRVKRARGYGGMWGWLRRRI